MSQTKLELQRNKIEEQIKKLKTQLKELNRKISDDNAKAREEKLIASGKILEQFHVIDLGQPLNEMEKYLSDLLSEAEWNMRPSAAEIELPNEKNSEA